MIQKKAHLKSTNFKKKLAFSNNYWKIYLVFILKKNEAVMEISLCFKIYWTEFRLQLPANSQESRMFWRPGTCVIFPGKLYDDMMSHLFLVFIFQHNHKDTNLQRETEASLTFTVDLTKKFLITLFFNTYFVIYFCLTCHWLSFDYTD